MERYQEYQDSGVEWIGEIPKGWKVEKLKYLATIMNGQDYKNIIADEGYPVIGSGGIFATATKYLYDGESVLLGRKGTIDKPIYIKGAFWTVDTMYYTVINDVCLPKLLYYLCTQIRFDYYQYGSAVPSMTSKDLNNIKFSLPDVNEQQAIVSYLDAKCAVIDSEIARRQDIVAKCQEYRQSLITETVTHGLDPAAPMRDSGVEWIGKIPKGWKVGKLKYNVSIDKETLPEDTPDDCEFNYVDIGSVSRENGIEKVQKLTFGKAPSRARKVLHEGDVIVSTVRTYLKAIAVIDEKPKELLVASTGFAVLASSKDMSSKYLGYYVLSEKFVQLVSKLSKGVSYPAISSSDLANIKAIVPPLATQQAIVAYLDTQCAEIDGIIKNNTEVVGKLEELKKSLIFEVVTGKRRVG